MRFLIKLIGSFMILSYCIIPMFFTLIILLLMPILFLSDINDIITLGFAGQNSGLPYMFVCGFFIGISIIIPLFRKIYRLFPWLYACTKILYVNLIILSIGELILNYGYEVKSTSRHTIFIFLMVMQIVICRIGMCIYFKRKPAKYIGEM